MPFDWKTYVDLAEVMSGLAAGATNPEAHLRSALSRAYYGAFCYVRNHARDRLGFKPRDDGDDHGHLRAFLKNGKSRNLSDMLQRLRRWRNECDYQDELTFDPAATFALALADAKRIFARLAPPSSSFEG